MNNKREAHLFSFVYIRAHDVHYTQGGNRELRRYDAPILRDIKSNNKSFEMSILFQGAITWNRQTVEEGL